MQSFYLLVKYTLLYIFVFVIVGIIVYSDMKEIFSFSAILKTCIGLMPLYLIAVYLYIKTGNKK